MQVEKETTINIGSHTLRVIMAIDAAVYLENYGADADGNRGMPMHFIDVLDLTVRDFNGNDITAKLRQRFPRLYEDLDSRCEEFVSDYVD